MNEQEFISFYNTNSVAAFNYLIDTYSTLIYNVALNQVFNKEDAEDLTQEIFISIHKSLPSFKGDSKLSTWIYSISLNKSREYIRSKTRIKRKGNIIQLDDFDKNNGLEVIGYNHPGIELENKELANIFFSAIDRLPDNQRIAFTLHKMEGFSYQEISIELDITVSSVESLMFRAKKNLKTLLEDFYKNHFE